MGIFSNCGQLCDYLVFFIELPSFIFTAGCLTFFFKFIPVMHYNRMHKRKQSVTVGTESFEVNHMLNRTTSFLFSKYGEVFRNPPESDSRPPKNFKLNVVRLRDKQIHHFMHYDKPVYLRALSGIIMLIVAKRNDPYHYERFVIHRVIKLRPDTLFNCIPISQNAKYEISFPIDSKYEEVKIPDDLPIVYERLIPKINIQEILSCYYQVRNANYSFPGEKHNYYELTYIDNGSLTTTVDGEEYELNKLDLIIYGPGQFHTQSTGPSNSCSYLTVMFEMDCENPYLLTNRVYQAHKEIYAALNNFIKVSNLEHMYDDELMLCYLKEIIVLILQFDFNEDTPVTSSPMQERFESELLNEIVQYINAHIYEQFTIEEICHQFSISRSSLQTLFKNNLKTAPKQYISNLKLNKGKLLIKESTHTISEISSMLGFTSVHYFSRKFKQEFGITPSDYAKSIYQ